MTYSYPDVDVLEPVEEQASDGADFADRVRSNQARLAGRLERLYDFIVCGAGSSGSVVARRLAENPSVTVLLLEAGGDDDCDWIFQSQPDRRINGRSIPFPLGKGLGGGSSMSSMVWARGHRQDWDSFAAVTGDSAWNYESVLGVYRSLEDWHGAPDPKYRGTGGPVFVQPAPDPNPLAPATVEGARAAGIPTFENPNGRMMEAEEGASISDVRARQGKRESIFRSYAFPFMHRPNLTVLTNALVTRLTFDGKRATGVEVCCQGVTCQIRAGLEVVLSLGAIHTPKILMQSGIGDKADLAGLGIPVVQHLPGVGRNFQDHVGFDCVWEHQQAMEPRNALSEAIFFSTSKFGLTGPDLFVCQAQVAKSSKENAAQFGLPSTGWTLFGAVAHPTSRGRLRLTGSHPLDPIQIEANTLSNGDDLKAAIACVELCREVGNSAPLRPFVKREVMPGRLSGPELIRFVQNGASSFWDEAGTAKMGRDSMSVVDGCLRVYGIENLRIADASILPRMTTGNTMAPCVVIGERAAEALKTRHAL